MTKWYVRDRGRVIGPLSEDQLHQMRLRRQIHGFHEISQDQTTWRPIDLVLGTDRNDSTLTAPQSPNNKRANTPKPNRDKTAVLFSPFRLIVAAVSFAIIGILFAGFLLIKSSGKNGDSGKIADRGSNVAGAVPIAGGVIRFDDKTTDTDRYKAMKESVCLVVPGNNVTMANGEKLETNVFPRPSKDKSRPFSVASGTGSGFIVSPDGYILTNRHVTESFDNYSRSSLRNAFLTHFDIKKDDPVIWVFFGREEQHPAKLVYQSAKYDFSILKIDKLPAHFFSLGDTPPTNLPPLNGLTSAGFPGVDRDPLTEKDLRESTARSQLFYRSIIQAYDDSAYDFSARDGRMIKKAEKRQMRSYESESYIVRHDAKIFPGNSGGPLIARNGTVLGINTWGGDTLNFALTLPQLREELSNHIPNITWRSLLD